MAIESQGPGAGWGVADGHMRASDADRERVIDALKVAFVQGRLSISELTRRAGQALESRTYAELAGATAGIPAGRAAAPAARKAASPVRPVPVTWKVAAWVVGLIIVVPGLAVAFFDTYYGSFFILLLFGFVASSVTRTRGPDGAGCHGVF